jgi:hypothetical protein
MAAIFAPFSKGGMNMDPTRNSSPDQRSKLTSPLKPPPGKLTAEDITRLSAKREEIIMVLQLWHGYSRIVADRVFSHWLYLNSVRSRPAGLTHSDSTMDILQDKVA